MGPADPDPARALSKRLHAVVHDQRVLEAIESVPRDRFVPADELGRAYQNMALPIGCGQAISQPTVVARMLELLELSPADRVLDVGTGSGYHAALLSRLAAEVWTIERHPELTASAQTVLSALGMSNVTCLVGDGGDGLPERAPFDAINIAAAIADALPPALEQQLAPGGRLVAPMGTERQHLVRVRRTDAGLIREKLDPVSFVPLVRDTEH